MDVVIDITDAHANLAADLFGQHDITLGETVSAPGNALITNLSEGALGIDESALIKLLLENLDQIAIAVFANFLTEALKYGGKLIINRKPVASDETAIIAELQRLRADIEATRGKCDKQETGGDGVG